MKPIYISIVGMVIVFVSILYTLLNVNFELGLSLGFAPYGFVIGVLLFGYGIHRNAFNEDASGGKSKNE